MKVKDLQDEMKQYDKHFIGLLGELEGKEKGIFRHNNIFQN